MAIGCRIIDPGYGNDPDPPSLVVKILETRVSGGRELDFGSEMFRMKIPRDAIPREDMLSIFRADPSVEIAAPPEGFTRISPTWTFKTLGRPQVFTKPVFLQFPYEKSMIPSGGQISDVFVACRDPLGEWRFLSPSVDDLGILTAVEAYHFSDWAVMAREPRRRLSTVMRAPRLETDPPVLSPDSRGLFERDSHLNIFLESSAGISGLLAGGDLELTLTADKNIPLEVSDPENPSSRQSLIGLGTGEFEPINVFRHPLARIDQQQDVARVRLGLAFTGKRWEEAPERIFWTLTLKDHFQTTYERRGEILFSRTGHTIVLTAPAGEISGEPVTFSWQCLPDDVEFSRLRLQIAPGNRGFLLPALDIELHPTVATYSLSASETAQLRTDTTYSWRVLGLRGAQPPLTSAAATFIWTAGPGELSVVDTDPRDGDRSVTPDSIIRVAFNRALSLPLGSGVMTFEPEVAGQLQAGDNTLFFFPDSPLSLLTTYTVRIASTITDLNGTTPGGELVFAFTTIGTGTLSPPSVVRKIPEEAAIDVPPTRRIEVVFDQEMAQTKVEAAFRLVPSAGSPVFTWKSGKHLIISFAGGFDLNTRYRVTFTTVAKTNNGISLPADSSWSFTTASVRDVGRPELLDFAPADDSRDIPVNAPLLLTFSEGMDQGTVQTGIKLLEPSTPGLTFAWEPGDAEVAVSPTGTWASSTVHRFLIASECLDLSGNRLKTEKTISFVTGDKLGPTLVSSNPVDNTRVNHSLRSLQFTFSRAMDPAFTEAAFSISPVPTTTRNFEWSPDRRMVRVEWVASLTEGIDYSAGFSNRARSADGVWLVGRARTRFQVVDSMAPTIVALLPASGTTNLPRNAPLRVTFSEPMDRMTVESAIRIYPDSGSLAYSWDETGSQVTIAPGEMWPAQATITLEISVGARDLFANALSQVFQATFRTSNLSAPVLISSTPANGAASVSRTSPLTFAFSQAMNQASFGAAFSLNPSISGTFSSAWSADGKTVVMTPSTSYANFASVTAQIASSATDVNGQPLNLPVSLAFSTQDTQGPILLAADPTNNKTNVPTNSVLQFTFDDLLDQTSAAAAFSILPAVTGGYAVNLSASGKIVQVNFPGGLAENTSYTCKFSTLLADVFGNKLSQSIQTTFLVTAGALPAISSTIPTGGAVNVAKNSPLVITFNKAMQTSSVSVTVTPAPAGTQIVYWSEQNRVLSVSYAEAFQAGTVYQFAVGNQAKDQSGQLLTGTTSFSFTVGNVVAPTVTATTPSQNAVGVSLTGSISIAFDKSMNQTETQNAFSLSPTISGGKTFSWSGDGKTMTVSFSDPFVVETDYAATVSTAARDTDGTALAVPFTLNFSTSTAPKVAAGFLPAADAVDMPLSTVVQLPFSRTMDQTSVQNAFSLKYGSVAVSGVFSWSGNTLTFTPSSPLPYSSTLNVSVSTSARDESGIALAAPFQSSFQTIPAPGILWQQKVVASPFSGRSDFALVTFNNALWLIGGFDGEYSNEVWTSADGENWTQVAQVAPFTARSGHAVAVLDGKLWMTGGENDDSGEADYLDDVWSSENGATWIKENNSAEYYARRDHAVLSFDNQLWMLAGLTIDADSNQVILGDVWVSGNGKNWTEKGSLVTFFPRRNHSAVVHDGKMWVLGGYGLNALGAEGPLNDVWESTNGDSWIRKSETSGYPSRLGAGCTAHAGLLWLVGGATIDGAGTETFYNDVWSSGDGITWLQNMAAGPPSPSQFSARGYTGLASIGGKLILVGGEDQGGYVDDIWSAQ
jgi:hypothetical protein